MGHLYTHSIPLTTRSRHVWLNSREYLVAPAVMIRAGVFHGNRGPALHPLEELQRSIAEWDGHPVVLNHPTDAAGEALSAHDETIQPLGTIQNARLDGDRLVAELWIDTQTASTHPDPNAALLVAQLDGVQPSVEGSVGFFANDLVMAGEYNGVPYTHVCTDIIPDHFALLSHGIGACSIADGCGAPRVRQHTPCQGACCMPHITTNQTDVDIRLNLYAALAREADVPFTAFFIEAVEGSTFVYRQGERLLRRGFVVADNGEIQLSGDPEDVHQVTTFVPVTNEDKELRPTTRKGISVRLQEALSVLGHALRGNASTEIVEAEEETEEATEAVAEAVEAVPEENAEPAVQTYSQGYDVAKAIVDLCAESGKPEQAARFLANKCTLEQAREQLYELRAHENEQTAVSSHTTPGASTPVAKPAAVQEIYARRRAYFAGQPWEN